MATVYNPSYQITPWSLIKWVFASRRGTSPIVLRSVKGAKARRRHPRLAIVLPMEYRRMHDPYSRTGLSINLSNGGFLFSCRRDLSVGAILAVIVMFVDGFELTKLDASAKIIWKELICETDWNEHKYGAGFLSISKTDQQKLTQLLNGNRFENLKPSSIQDRWVRYPHNIK